MLWSDTYAWIDEYWYHSHLLALKKNVNLSFFDHPMEVVLRGFVYSTLYYLWS
jgi:hypothetical protein